MPELEKAHSDNALRRAERQDSRIKVLFICEANIGRSQMAEAIFKGIVEGKAEAESAGVGEAARVYSGKTIGSISLDLVRYVKEIGRDISQNRVKPMTKEMFDGADVVVFMVNGMKNVPDYAKNSDKAKFWDVEDAKTLGGEETRVIRDKIKGLVEQLAKELL